MIIEVKQDGLTIFNCHIWDVILRVALEGGIVLGMKHGVQGLTLTVNGDEIPQPPEWSIDE